MTQLHDMEPTLKRAAKKHRPHEADSLSLHLREIHALHYLSAEEEYAYACAYHDHQHKKSGEMLVKAHLRLVTKVASQFKGYGLPMHDLVAEGHVGLMQALHKFDPQRVARFGTYALHWIQSAIKQYILTNWSLVKIGTTAAQKKLFFKLRSEKNKLLRDHEELSDADAATISLNLNVRTKDVTDMNQRLSGTDSSLNMTFGDEGDSSWQDALIDDSPNQEMTLSEQQLLHERRLLLEQAIHVLTERELHILQQRRLLERPRTLEDLAESFGLTRERIRQIESSAFNKLQKMMFQQGQPLSLTVN